MRANDPASIPTRQSLLERLKALGNQEDWRRFFDTYTARTPTRAKAGSRSPSPRAVAFGIAPGRLASRLAAMGSS